MRKITVFLLGIGMTTIASFYLYAQSASEKDIDVKVKIVKSPQIWESGEKYHVSLSPEGKKIVWWGLSKNERFCNYYLTDLEKGKTIRLTNNEKEYSGGSPIWFSGSKKVLCSQAENIRWAMGEEMIIDADTGVILKIVYVPPFGEGPEFQEISRIIEEWKQSSSNSKVRQMKALGTPTFSIQEERYTTTKTIGTLTQEVTHIRCKLYKDKNVLLEDIDHYIDSVDNLQWAPDGKKFAIRQEVEREIAIPPMDNYIIERPTKHRLWVIDRTGQKTLISDMPAYHSNIQWFPDSKRLLFTASTKEGSDIFIATIEGESKE